MFDDIQTEHESLDERNRDAVIRSRCEGEDIYLLCWYRACNVSTGTGDWNTEGDGFSGAEGDLFYDLERHDECVLCIQR